MEVLQIKQLLLDSTKDIEKIHLIENFTVPLSFHPFSTFMSNNDLNKVPSN